MFRDREIHKEYLALVHGQLPGEEGQIDLPLAADWPARPRQKVDTVHGKPSQTLWKMLTYDAHNNISRVALTPLTGRTHQLRVHMLALGHPIVGDQLYGAADAAPRLFLQANHLAFAHPVTAAPLMLSMEPEF